MTRWLFCVHASSHVTCLGRGWAWVAIIMVLQQKNFGRGRTFSIALRNKLYCVVNCDATVLIVVIKAFFSHGVPRLRSYRLGSRRMAANRKRGRRDAYMKLYARLVCVILPGDDARYTAHGWYESLVGLSPSIHKACGKDIIKGYRYCCGRERMAEGMGIKYVDLCTICCVLMMMMFTVGICYIPFPRLGFPSDLRPYSAEITYWNLV
jgi:hypothetical protein